MQNLLLEGCFINRTKQVYRVQTFGVVVYLIQWYLYFKIKSTIIVSSKFTYVYLLLYKPANIPVGCKVKKKIYYILTWTRNKLFRVFIHWKIEQTVKERMRI